MLGTLEGWLRIRWRRSFPGSWPLVLLALPGLFAARLCASDIVVSEIMYRPASADRREEFLELFNRGTNRYNLAGWSFADGVRFTFPSVVVGPGEYLAVAADLPAFRSRYPDVTNVVGGWEGQLAENGESISLVNLLGEEEDSVTYASEGDWGVRERGPDDRGHRGWLWTAPHDGGGPSLELINPWFANRHGQNWTASAVAGGTPGRQNTGFRTNIPPVILDVIHFPMVPSSRDTVAVRANVQDENSLGIVVSLCHRLDGAPAFSETPMADDGQHGDGGIGDGIYGAVLPARPHNTVIEFYVSARDTEGNQRTWPAPSQPAGTQSANCLYQVDDTREDGLQPFYRLITTEVERAELEAIGQLPWWQSSDAQMNATFISREAGVTECRYTTGLRMRGGTSRALASKNRRVNLPNDRLWRDQDALNLNVANPHSQIAASALCQLVGVPTAYARAVQVRENNRQLAGTAGSPFGVYAHVEPLGGEYAEIHFPTDPDGNLYHAREGNLEYLGEDPAAYAAIANYSKMTHSSENDWSDIIRLTRVLNTAADAQYATAVRQVADVEEWARYFAIHTVLGSGETSLATGANGDYALYCGVADPRALLVAYDLDSVLGVAIGPNASIYRATNSLVGHRFLTHPEFAPLYLAEVRRQATTVLAPEHVNPLLDRLLAGWVPAANLQAMKDFVVARNAFVLSQIPTALTASSDLPVAAGTAFRRTTSPHAALRGTADPVRTRRVVVNGQAARWEALTGLWDAPAVPLLPGVNWLNVMALDADGQEVERLLFAVWRDTGSTTNPGSVLTANTLWRAEQGPYRVAQALEIPAGITLAIEPGTSVYFDPAGSLQISGRLLAEGTADRPIALDRTPGASGSWGGLSFVNATNENRLAHVCMANYSPRALFITNSVVVAEHIVWTNSTHKVIFVVNSSLAVRHSRFPNLLYEETVGGGGILPGGFMIFEGNIFGVTHDYNDIMDYSGCKRPGPILQILDNVFMGGGDDALDLDGTDAHIEGNVFMHFHKDNSSTSESSAIAMDSYAGNYSELVVVRNVFYDNDYAMVMKGGAVVHAHNNTFASSAKGALCFAEPGRPGSAPASAVALDGNIFWQQPAVMANLDTNLLTQGVLKLRVDRSILPQPGPWSGEGNRNEDPRFLNPSQDFRLRPGSPALGAGPFGIDMGAMVPAGPRITGEPRPLTRRRDAKLTVSGPGLTHYRYRLNAGSWSADLPVTQPIALSSLSEGTHRVAVIGRNSAGAWQPEDQAVLSRSWTVSSAAPRLWLSEILARNVAAVPIAGGHPDLVELHNDSPEAAEVSGLSLSDDPDVPDKYVFPANTVMPANSYLVLIADRAVNPAGLHLGFALDDEGESLTLYDRAENGGQPLDSVTFGLQVPDRSIARLDDGHWALALPTFGEPNQPARLGDASRVRINEWLANTGIVFRDDFVELHNPDTQPVAIGGFHLTDEPVTWPKRQQIPPLSFIPAGGYAVFYADPDIASGRNRLEFHLALEVGMIGLSDAAGVLIDQIPYGPQRPDVSEGRSPSGSSTILFFETPTPGAGGGAVNPQNRAVVLNEISAHAVDWISGGQDAPDWIEFYNTGDVAADLGGMSLSDRLEEPQRWVFPAGTTLGARQFLVVLCDSLAPASAGNTGFGLSADGDEVYLFDRLENGGNVIESVVFGVQAMNHSLGRVPVGIGAWRLTAPTPGASNVAAALGDPSQLRINEWMADPETGNDWFELFNAGSRPVDLSGLHFTDDLADPTKSQVPPLSYLGVGPGAYQVFVADSQPGQGADHVDFKLSGNGETIGLASASGFLLDSVVFGTQEEGVSEGRMPDGASRIIRFPGTTTRGSANTDTPAPRLSAAVLPDPAVLLVWDSVPGGLYAVERSPDLHPAQWTVLKSVTATENRTSFLDASPNGPEAFYRIRREH
ncbi:MAG TPA: lamin tail domain-containing protein [Verrucomicrobiota bacterium]|nr:lamin tail domain-containing protein [Verrucomicrobiota bacterium]HNU51864.1 lamin tail domain-containing protein [Verrucomicrobiota bacterium]